MSTVDRLKKIAQQKTIKARVGIIEPMTYPDGESVAEVGYWNEYGTDKYRRDRSFVPQLRTTGIS